MKKSKWEIKELYNQICAIKDYKPSSYTNNLFNRLVKCALSPTGFCPLSRNQLCRLQNNCSLAEFELEKYWSKRVLSSDAPEKELRKFPYYKNYEKLTQMEWYSLLSCCDHKKHKILFIGGGPLPLTAYMLVRQFKQEVTVLEKDMSAYTLSKKLITALKIENKIKVTNCDAVDYLDYRRYNLIILAALAGIESNAKLQILKKIKKNTPKSTHILARSSWGMRQILYRPLDKKIAAIFKPLIEVRPHNDIVNSVVIFSNK